MVLAVVNERQGLEWSSNALGVIHEGRQLKKIFKKACSILRFTKLLVHVHTTQIRTVYEENEN
jgi:CRISPR/Cas system CSM-associated protein Csm2 small subunit